MQMQVGGFRFEAAAGGAEYSELTRRARRRWAARERHGRPAQLEDLGRDAEVITLRGDVWVSAAADLAALDALRTEAGLSRSDDAPARPLPVFRGGGAGDSGEYLGEWAVTALTERERNLRFDGTPARISFDLSLTEHVP